MMTKLLQKSINLFLIIKVHTFYKGAVYDIMATIVYFKDIFRVNKNLDYAKEKWKQYMV